jgi:Zn-finger nucleic acid-binding protein
VQCPNCQGQLATIQYERTEIQQCPSCKGTLLDEESLVEIEKTRVRFISRSKSHTVTGRYEGSRTCPNCDISMEKVKYGKYSPKTIDKCPQCNVIWLDEGELEDIQVAYEIYEENTKQKNQ